MDFCADAFLYIDLNAILHAEAHIYHHNKRRTENTKRRLELLSEFYVQTCEKESTTQSET